MLKNSISTQSRQIPTWFGTTRLRILVAILLAWPGPLLADNPSASVVRLLPPTQPEILPPPAPQPPVVAKAGLTLADLENMALSRNPSLARAAALVGAARGNWVQVGLPPNPSVGYEGQQLGSGGLAEQQGVLFSQEIVRGEKLRLNRVIADREVAVAQQQLAAQRLRVLTDVRIAYFQVLLAQQQIDLSENIRRISTEGAQAAENLFLSKEVGRTDLLQAQLEVENAQILVENAHNRQEAAWRSLAAIIGNPSLPPEHLLGDATAPPRDFKFEEVLARIKGMSPEISAAAMEVSRAQSALDRARVEPIPNLTFQGLVNVQDNGIGGKPDGGVAVTVPVPLFNRNQGAMLRAQHEIAAARNALAQTELSLQNRLAPTFEQFQNARNQVARYREQILPAAQESLELTRKMYAAGELNFVGLLTMQRTFAYMHLNYLETLRSLRVAETEIEGLLLRGSLETQPTNSPIGATNAASQSVPIGGVELFR